MQKAIELTALDSPDRGIYLNNLALSIGEKYRQTGNIADFEEENRVILGPADVTLPQPGSLSNSAVQLQYKYARTGALVDLNNAIEAIRKAIGETSTEHVDRPMLLNNLGISLGDRYLRIGEIANLEETPVDHPRRLCS